MNVRVQTYEKNTNEVLRNNLETISNISDILTSKFDDAMKKFHKNKI